MGIYLKVERVSKTCVELYMEMYLKPIRDFLLLYTIDNVVAYVYDFYP